MRRERCTPASWGRGEGREQGHYIQIGWVFSKIVNLKTCNNSSIKIWDKDGVPTQTRERGVQGGTSEEERPPLVRRYHQSLGKSDGTLISAPLGIFDIQV